MKRSEIIEDIKDDLEALLINLENCHTIKAHQRVLKSGAEGILDMLEGYGMEPPVSDKTNINEWDKE